MLRAFNVITIINVIILLCSNYCYSGCLHPRNTPFVLNNGTVDFGTINPGESKTLHLSIKNNDNYCSPLIVKILPYNGVNAVEGYYKTNFTGFWVNQFVKVNGVAKKIEVANGCNINLPSGATLTFDITFFGSLTDCGEKNWRCYYRLIVRVMKTCVRGMIIQQ